MINDSLMKTKCLQAQNIADNIMGMRQTGPLSFLPSIKKSSKQQINSKMGQWINCSLNENEKLILRCTFVYLPFLDLDYLPIFHCHCRNYHSLIKWDENICLTWRRVSFYSIFWGKKRNFGHTCSLGWSKNIRLVNFLGETIGSCLFSRKMAIGEVSGRNSCVNPCRKCHFY